MHPIKTRKYERIRIIGAASGIGAQDRGCEDGPVAFHRAQAWHDLGWRGVWDFRKTVEQTVAWYRDHALGKDVAALTSAQIAAYQRDALLEGLVWTK